MLRFLPLVLVLLASQVHAQTLTVAYARAESGLSEATLSLDRSARSVDSIQILSSEGLLVRITDFESDGDALTARAMLPPAGEIAIILIDAVRGGMTGWVVADGSASAWLDGASEVYDQTGRRVASEDELIAIRERVESFKEPREVRVTRRTVQVRF